MTADQIVAALALVIGVVAMVLAIKKQRNTPIPVSKITTDLQRKVALLERDIASLQRMLVEKQNEIDGLTKRIRDLERNTPMQPLQPQHDRVLVAALGTDKEFMLDRNALLEVQAKTGLQLQRIFPVTKQRLSDYITRRRMEEDPVRYVHFALHSGPTGLQFADGIADGVWLAGVLTGVEVVVLAGCESDAVADMIGVVPAVVSMREDVTHQDASNFTLAFWMEIGNGATTKEAFKTARNKVPAVAEFVELHL